MVQTLPVPVTLTQSNLEITAKPVFESYKFWQSQQTEGEPFDKLSTELRIIASNFEFGTSRHRQLRNKIMLGINDSTSRQRMLEEDNFTSS